MGTEASVHVRVRAFARVRELFGGDFELVLDRGATLADVWEVLRAQRAELDRLSASVRLAVNGRISPLLNVQLCDGDEVSILPPVGGG